MCAERERDDNGGIVLLQLERSKGNSPTNQLDAVVEYMQDVDTSVHEYDQQGNLHIVQMNFFKDKSQFTRHRPNASNLTGSENFLLENSRISSNYYACHHCHVT